MTARTHFVYRVYDEFGLLLYVGCSKNPEKRRKSHEGDRAAWLPYMATARLEGPYLKANAFAQEKSVIVTEAPFFNAQPEHMSHNLRRRKVRDDIMSGVRAANAEVFARIHEAYDEGAANELHRLIEDVERETDRAFGREMGPAYRLDNYLSARRREAVKSA
jgi:hypothetical protein